MSRLNPLTELQTIEIMLCESKNELTKCEVLDRMFTRLSLRGNISRNEQMAGMNQAKIRALKESIRELADMHKEALDAQPKEGES